MNKRVIHKILKQVEKKFNRGKRDTWKNRDFEDLSFVVHQETKVLISVATLKRIFGKVKTDKNYSPQESTIKTLADFSGYIPDEDSSRMRYVFIGLVILAVIVSVLSIVINLWDAEEQNNGEKVKGNIELIKTEGICPKTAYFQLDIPETEDSVFVYFGDDSQKKFVNNQSILSHFYAYPGQFVARLECDGKTLATSPKILVATDNWQAFAYYYSGAYDAETKMRYYPIPLEKALQQGYFHVAPRTISSLGIDTTQIVSVHLSNYKETHINGDCFYYQVTLKNSIFWPAIRCYSSILTIEGDQGKIQFKLVSEGCSSFASYEAGEVKKTGFQYDLTYLTLDRSKWQDIHILNQDKKVRLVMNADTVLDVSYQKSIGRLLGTSVEFHGSGSVDNILLKANGVAVFEGDGF